MSDHGALMALSEGALLAKRDQLLNRVSMTWEQMVTLADAHDLDVLEANIYNTIRAIDWLLQP